ncbi:heterogeneous nuclear ribonucleoprotein A0 [Trifolium repens]|nr:heterogeneous nuclear ribonucleoprotein A0 [Trifolium repens]
MGWDDGEWTEVRRRRRKVHRQRDTGIDSVRLGERLRRDETPLSRRSYSSERRTCYPPFHRDRRVRQVPSRYRFAESQQRFPRGFDSDSHAPVRAREQRQWNDVVGRHQVSVLTQRRPDEKHQAFPSPGDGMIAQVAGGINNNSFSRQRYVSFYFTNFPIQLSHFYLRKGFEVCGMLEDIYVARKRNKQGQPYGFVRFSNVRDITKLTKALNAVCFGDFRVRARVARFDRNNVPADETKVDGVEAGVLGAKKAVDKPKGQIFSLDEGKPHVKAKQRCETLAVRANGSFEEGVRGEFDGIATQKQEDMKQDELATVEGKESRVYVRSYKAAPDDVEWARCGVVAAVANGEAGSVVRRRLEDAGFNGLDLVHLGGAKVLVRSLDGTDVLAVLDGAKDFFSMCFSHWVRWETTVIPFQRGAWVRLYGIPLHAWNCNFFKLCVMDCGRFLRSDNYTAAKDRLDFARVLITTTAMAVIKKVENLMVDGSLVVVQIVEEWGYELGDDACLLEDDTVSKASPAAEDVFHCDSEASDQVDMLIDQIAKGVSDETHAQKDDTQSVKILDGAQSSEVAGRPRDGQFKCVLEPVVTRPDASDSSTARVAVTEMSSDSTGPRQVGNVSRVPVCSPQMVKASMPQARR